jgi:hypothetical protein
MGHSNSNSNPNHLNHHGLEPNTRTAHRPTRARPSPASLLLLSHRTAQPTRPTGHGPAQPAGLTAPRPFSFRPRQLTSGAHLSAFPSSSLRAPQHFAPAPPHEKLPNHHAFSSFACAALPRSRHRPAPRLACPCSMTQERNCRASRVGHPVAAAKL